MKILLTGGAGFIGSAMIRYIINKTSNIVINVDKLTYAANVESLRDVAQNERYYFERVDICCSEELQRVFKEHQPDVVMHLAAESHVDRSIKNSLPFIQTNIIGTYILLEAAREYWLSLPLSRQKKFRFHHISTDEVYGDLGNSKECFSELTPYAPSSPYSASKASSDHLVRAWYKTYGLPIVITNCSNNYGPYQFPEKLIPKMILKALAGEELTIYGSGEQIRDWLYVEDHVDALYQVLTHGEIGETFNIGGFNEKKNLEVIWEICSLLEELAPEKPHGIKHYADLIAHVKDREGHDLRYAIDATKITHVLKWHPLESFKTGLRKTVEWYLQNRMQQKETMTIQLSKQVLIDEGIE